MTEGLRNEWLKISPDKKGQALPDLREYIEVLYRIVQEELKKANSELLNKNVLSQEDAENKCASRYANQLPKSFTKVKLGNYSKAVKCEGSTLGAEALVSTDLGENYYIIAHKYLEAYLNGYGKLPDYIGYSLDDCTTDYQKALLSDICSLKKEKAVCILSKGVWGNEDLIKNIPVPLTLEYFEAAINYLGQLINEVKKDKKKAKDITMCLEFVLCVFRLRSYKDEELNKLLSLNNKYVKKLYKYVETLIENKIEIHSFLSLEIKNKGVYEDVPNILYALLLFITGAEGAGDIKIAGLSLDDLTT